MVAPSDGGGASGDDDDDDPVDALAAQGTNLLRDLGKRIRALGASRSSVVQATFTIRGGVPGAREEMEKIWNTWVRRGGGGGTSASGGGGVDVCGGGGGGAGSIANASTVLTVVEGELRNPRVWVRLEYAVVNKPVA